MEPFEIRDYYERLGVESSATTEEIKDSYRKMALQCHPDRDLDNLNSHKNFIAVSQAFEILSNPRMRAEYDRLSRLAEYDRLSKFEKMAKGSSDYSSSSNEDSHHSREDSSNDDSSSKQGGSSDHSSSSNEDSHHSREDSSNDDWRRYKRRFRRIFWGIAGACLLGIGLFNLNPKDRIKNVEKIDDSQRLEYVTQAGSNSKVKEAAAKRAKELESGSNLESKTRGIIQEINENRRQEDIGSTIEKYLAYARFYNIIPQLSPKDRIKDVEKIDDPQILRYIAWAERDPAVEKAVMKKIYARDYKDRIKDVEKIDDTPILRYIAQTDSNSRVKEAAAKRAKELESIRGTNLESKTRGIIQEINENRRQEDIRYEESERQKMKHWEYSLN